MYSDMIEISGKWLGVRSAASSACDVDRRAVPDDRVRVGVAAGVDVIEPVPHRLEHPPLGLAEVRVPGGEPDRVARADLLRRPEIASVQRPAEPVDLPLDRQLL